MLSKISPQYSKTSGYAYFFEIENSRNRIEKRTVFVTNDTEWLHNKEQWEGLKCCYRNSIE